MPNSFIKKNFFVFLFFASLSFLIFALDQGNFFTPIKDTVLNGLTPLMKFSRQSSYYLTRPFAFLIETQEKEERLKKLEKEALEIQALQIRFDELRKENEFLKEALGLSKKKQRIFLAAQVIGRTDEIGHSLIIDMGQEQGLRGEEAVLLPGYYLIGKVEKVWPGASIVKLINSPDFSASVRGQKSGTEALLTGNSNDLSIEIFDHQDKPIINEFFLTSGLDGVFLPGLIVGQLTAIKKKPTAISRLGQIALPVNLRHLERVLVLKNDTLL